jgi:hypothetical protein
MSHSKTKSWSWSPNWSGSITISGLNIASGGAQYLALLRYFSHPSFSYFFPTPPINLKLGLQIGGRLLIATYADQPNDLAN